MGEPFRIVFILYPRLTQLDFTGPYEVLARMPGAEIVLAFKDGGSLGASVWSRACRRADPPRPARMRPSTRSPCGAPAGGGA